MKLFIDSGNIKDIETLAAIGIIDGVTTNPTLLAKEPGDFRENLKKICQIVKGPVSGEVTATDFAGMLSQGDRSGEASLVSLATQYLKTRYAKPGNVYVGLLHRLDRPASGVMRVYPFTSCS